jgi:hypothetical protein
MHTRHQHSKGRLQHICIDSSSVKDMRINFLSFIVPLSLSLAPTLFTQAIRYLLCLFLDREEKKIYSFSREKAILMIRKSFSSLSLLSLSVYVYADRTSTHFCIYMTECVYTYCSLLLLE